MFFSLKSDCYFRRYENIGYIIRPIISIEEVVNKTGAFFLDELTYSPQSLDDIVERLKKRICNVPLIELKQDVSSFYFELVENGFLNYSEKLQDFRNDGFEYATLEGKLAYKTIKSSVEEKSSDFLVDYFKEHPHLQTFHVEVTSKCNERCIHCYIPHENKTSDINTDFMINVIDQCKETGA